MRSWVAVAWGLVGCAPAISGTAPGAGAAALSQILAGPEPGCPEDDLAACCAALDERMRAARARGDDRAADEEAERLAVSCPQRRRDLLKDGAGGLSYRRRKPDDQSQVTVTYELTLAASDRITWLAEYFRGARLGKSLPPGAGELEITFHVVAGEGPGAGQVFKVRQVHPLTLGPKQSAHVFARFTREPGATPFRLALVTKVHGDEGSIFQRVQTPALLRNPPPFEPPDELREAGAPQALISACPDERGRIALLIVQGYLAAPHVHPRQLGAAFDWLRRLELSPPGTPDPRSSSCDMRRIRFDRAEIPPGNAKSPPG